MKSRKSLKKKFLNLFKKSSQKSLVINVARSGILHTLVSSNQKNTITQLTLTGSIDARDVSFIRDNMKKLTLLDIKLVSIKAYDGSHGTCKFSILYPANEMPQNSFYDCYEGTHNTTLKTVILPLTLIRIGYSAFLKCTNLNKLQFPDAVVYLDSLALLGCTKLTNKHLPTSLIAVGDPIFLDCTSLPSISKIQNAGFERDLQIA